MALLVFLLVLVSLVGCEVYGDSVVMTAAGKIRGMERETNGTGYLVFAGIPYADPPLRFAPPVAKTPWAENATFNATAFGVSCPQDQARLHAFAPEWFEIPPSATMTGEDCLTLNVYTPVTGNLTGSPLAVMVWFHGGSYRSGLGGLYDASQLAVKGGVVVVTVNYRLGPFGFLYTGDEQAPGNVGLMDQQLALRWVQDNIHAFGGDPSLVTIFGQSDIHGSPTVHLFAKESRSLFKRVAAHSGVMQTEDLLESSQAIEDAKLLAQAANCPSKSSGALVECLRRTSVENIVHSYEPYFSWQKQTSFAWRPVLTRDFFVSPDGDLSSYDLLSVFNSGDGSVALELIKDLYPDFNFTAGATENQLQQWLDVNLDKPEVVDIAVKRQYVKTDTMDENVARMMGLFNIQLDRTLYRYGVRALHPLLSSQTRLMIFHYPTSSATQFPDPYDLVPHGAELPYVFGLPLNEALDGQFTDDELTLSLDMIRYWSNFAKTGDPNMNESLNPSASVMQSWPKYGDNETYFLVNLETYAVGQRYRSHGVDFWSEYLDKLERAAEESCPGPGPKPTPEQCEVPVIGESLGIALTPQQADSLLEACMFIIVAMLCLYFLVFGAACGYRMRAKAVLRKHRLGMASEEGLVNNGAAGMGQGNPGFQRHEESATTSGSSSLNREQAAPLPLKQQEDDFTVYANVKKSHVTFSAVHHNSSPEEDEAALIDNEEQGDAYEMYLPDPPPDDLKKGGDDIGDNISKEEDFPPPPDDLEELNLSDEFNIPDEAPSSSPATTMSAEADPDAQRINDGDDDDDTSNPSSERDSDGPPAIQGGSQASDTEDEDVDTHL